MSEKLRAGKTGLGLQVEKKMEDNYDREEATGTPQKIREWVNAIIEGEHDPIPADDWKSINTHLRDGVALCKLMNKLLKADGQSAVQFQKKVMSPFVAMTNIENFNKGAMQYGLDQESTFQTADLWEIRKGPFLNVINTLHSLGFLANGKNVTPKYTGDIKKTLDME